MTQTVSPNGLTWNCDTCYGSLAIGGIDLNDLWVCVDVSSLWRSPDVRGDSDLLPGVPGLAANPYRVTETRHSLPLWVNGHYTTAGAEVGVGGNTTGTLATNVAYLMANVVLAAADVMAGYTQTAVLTLPDGSTVVAEVQVLGIPDPDLLPGAIFRSTLELRNPLGDLHL